ncbi:AsmA family protein [Henriciella aquimarina]|uniref:AsmA family protein n=1 Tax=Henriciella aquimarina TaxID=545261 RepID=UPI0009FFC9B4|nr:AsmA-like C-terminal region-containing protein [Henriciella aquimarina]
MRARTEKTVQITLMVLTGLLLALVLFLLALTQPRFGTPFANWALGTWGPEGSSVARAHLKFPALTTAVADDVILPDRLEAESVEARFNPFGFLPLVSWVSRLEGADGYIRFDGREGGDEDDETELSDYRAIVDEVALSNIALRLTRPDGQDRVMIEQARGSLRSGALGISATGADSTLDFEGHASNSLSAIKGDLRVTGDNFADLAALAGLAAPDTPPYDVVMGVDIEDALWRFDVRRETRVGDSDIAGPLIVTFGEGTPVVDADLVSETLDADDLGIVFGIPIGTGEGETVSATQKRARQAYDESDRLIPNVVIDFTRLDAIDGSVKYRAATVTDSVFDLTGLELDFEIDGRVVRAPLLQLSFDQGSLDAYATIDGTRSPAVTTAEGDLNDVAFANLALAPYLRGTAKGRFNVTATGDGFRAAADTLDGTLSIWSTDADVLALAVEGAALDIGEALTVLGEEADDRTYAETRCAVAVANMESGVATFDPAVIDTDDSIVLVHGDIDLGTERMKLSIRSDAKDASLGSLIGDVGIGGTLRHPELMPFSAKTVAQIGIASILGSLSGGLAALPFIEPGMAEDAPCGALLARAEAASGKSSPSD